MPIHRYTLPSLTAILMGLASSADANLITNGDFEMQQYPGPFTFSAPGGWSMSGAGNVVIHTSTTAIQYTKNSTFGPARSGTQYLDLSGNSTDHPTIYQDVATTPGVTYELSFFTGASNAMQIKPSIELQVSGTGTLLHRVFTPAFPSKGITWRPERIRFTADATTTRIAFRDVYTGIDDNTSFIEDVDLHIADTTVPATHGIAFKWDLAIPDQRAAFSSFGLPAINASGRTAFKASLVGADVTSADNTGIWADDANGVRHLVARKSGAAPGTSGAVFTAFDDPVFNDANEVAFRATLMNGVGDAVVTPIKNTIGIWSTVGGALGIVARQGTQAPGCPPGATFASFNQIALPNQGGVVFFAILKAGTAAVPDPGGTTSTNNQGIWAVDLTGELRLILRKGDVHPLTGKVVKSIVFLPAASGATGQTRSYNQSTGDLLYSATFADATTGIFTLVFP